MKKDFASIFFVKLLLYPYWSSETSRYEIKMFDFEPLVNIKSHERLQCVIRVYASTCLSDNFCPELAPCVHKVSRKMRKNINLKKFCAAVCEGVKPWAIYWSKDKNQEIIISVVHQITFFQMAMPQEKRIEIPTIKRKIAQRRAKLVSKDRSLQGLPSGY